MPSAHTTVKASAALSARLLAVKAQLSSILAGPVAEDLPLERRAQLHTLALQLEKDVLNLGMTLSAQENEMNLL